MCEILIIASCVFSKSLASLRELKSQAKVLSTTQHFLTTRKLTDFIFGEISTRKANTVSTFATKALIAGKIPALYRVN